MFNNLTAGVLQAALWLWVAWGWQAPPRPDPSRPGPWDHDVHLFWFQEGRTGEQCATFERAGVATLARMKDDRLIAAFQSFPADDPKNFDRVAVRFSGDEGRTWTPPQPIVMADLEADLMRPFDPTLVVLPDGRVRLYFTSNRTRDLRRSMPAIYSAISDDGVNYRFEPGVRFAVEGRMVIDCAVTLHGGSFHLIVPDNGAAGEPGRGAAPRSAAGRGYYAVSQDGLTFTRQQDLVMPRAENRWLGNLVSDQNRLYFFGTGPGPWPLVSVNGRQWSSEPKAFRIQGADPAAVKLKDGSWLIAATSSPRPGTPSARAAGNRPPAPPPR